jgi:hypothetical protein
MRNCLRVYRAKKIRERSSPGGAYQRRCIPYLATGTSRKFRSEEPALADQRPEKDGLRNAVRGKI